MHRSKWLALIALLGAADLMSFGCLSCNPPPPPPEPDSGVEVDAGVDAGPVDAGPDLSCSADSDCAEKVGTTYVCDQVDGSPSYGTCVAKCRIDDDCEPYQLGLRCEEKTGHCIPARGCKDDTNCPPQQYDPNDYCSSSGIQCRCVQGEKSKDGFDGVCRRRRGVCEECTDDTQCGYVPPPGTSVFEPQGRCLPLQGDPNGQLPDGGVRKYCFQMEAGCGCGMVRDPASGTCIPQSHTCSEVGCSEDKDCPFGSVCNVAQCLCEPRCVWNFDRKELNPPGCPPGRSCWVDPENLDPDSPYFGAGRCRPPCTDDSSCQALDPRLVCQGEEIVGGTSDKRCRPGGECMDDLQCPQEQGSIYLGYCDRHDFTCKTDCRTGTDPVTGQPFDDCISGYRCVNDNGTNICKQQTCMQLGGARLGCAKGEYCCGEDRDGDGVAEPCPLTGVDPDSQCYPAPQPPFCTECMSNSDCANINNTPLPSVCIYAGDRPDGSKGVNICAPATYNDFTVDENGVAKAYRGCPSKYSATTFKTKCQTNADCGPTGSCNFDESTTYPDGGHPLTCLCDADGTSNNTVGCPGDADAGTQTFCRFAPAGTRTQCIVTVACTPSPGDAYKDPAEGGCGL